MDSKQNNTDTLWYLFNNDKLLLKQDETGKLCLPTSQEVETWKPFFEGTIHRFTLSDACECRTVSVNLPNTFGAEWTLMTLRDAYDHLPLSHYKYGGRAYELLYWDAHSRFCPVCGTPTQQLEAIMKKCPSCKHEIYPPIATATIVLVRRGDEALLVRARNFRSNHYGLVAGFLEPGETLEECVAREVMEETGLTVTRTQYLFSLPNTYLYSGFLVHTLDQFFLCSVEDDTTLDARDDVAESWWIPLDEVNPALFGLDSVRQGVERFLKKVLNLEL